ncbi:MAG: hypothetical protein N3G22_01815 [Candidatus Micrarchaeota archaeon]|nr:hypothetical protein [Candidatus Micrarchaeota archaeon]
MVIKIFHVNSLMERFKPKQEPPVEFIAHNPHPQFPSKEERENAEKLKQFIESGGRCKIKNEKGETVAENAPLKFYVGDKGTILTSPKKLNKAWTIEPINGISQVIHPHTITLFVEGGLKTNEFIGMIKSTGGIQEYDGEKSIYDYIFDAAKFTKVDPCAIMAILACENFSLDVRDNNPRGFKEKKHPKKPNAKKETFDRGLFQISDEVRLDLNKDQILKKFISILSLPGEMEGGAIPKRLRQLAEYFGIQSEKYTNALSLARDLMLEVTGKKVDKKSGKLVDDGDKINSIKHNVFSASIWFLVNLHEQHNNYQLAAFTYKEGRLQTNNFLKGEKMQKNPVQNKKINVGAFYSWKFWSYYSLFKAYHSPMERDGFMQTTFEERVKQVFFQPSVSFASNQPFKAQ